MWLSITYIIYTKDVKRKNDEELRGRLKERRTLKRQSIEIRIPKKAKKHI